MTRFFFSCFAVLFLSACAGGGPSMPEKAAYQPVTVTTPGVIGANCFMQSGERSYSLSTPATVNIQKTTDVMDVTCFKGEHLVGNRKVHPSVAPREAGMGKGCISCNYPATIVIAMQLDERSMDRTVTHIRSIQ